MNVTRICSELVQINTENPPGRTDEAVEYVAEILESLGYRPRISKNPGGHWNVCAGPRDCDLLFCGHLDVVPAGDVGWTYDPFSGMIEDGFVWGRGTTDMKGGCAAILIALEWMVDTADNRSLAGEKKRNLTDERWSQADEKKWNQTDERWSQADEKKRNQTDERWSQADEKKRNQTNGQQSQAKEQRMPANKTLHSPDKIDHSADKIDHSADKTGRSANKNDRSPNKKDRSDDPPIGVAFVCDEETGRVDGIQHLLRINEFRPCDCLIAEPTPHLNPSIGQKGLCRFEATFRGQPGHGSLYPFAGENAIVKAVGFIDRLIAMTEKEYVPEAKLQALVTNSEEAISAIFPNTDVARLLTRITCNPGRIRGGEATNIVAEACTVAIDMRLPWGCSPEAVLAAVKADPAAPVICIESLAPPTCTPADSVLVRRLCKAIEHAYQLPADQTHRQPADQPPSDQPAKLPTDQQNDLQNDQTTNLQTNQPTNQSTDQTNKQPSRQPADQTNKLPINQRTEQPAKLTARPILQWAASDARFLRAAGFRAAEYGPGEIHLLHAQDERVRIDQLEKAVQVYEALIASYL